MNITDAEYFTFNVDNSIFLAGQTGSGKTEFVRKYIRRIEAAYTPEEMQYVIFDLKQIEFTVGAEDGAKKEYLYTDVILDPHKGLKTLEELATLSQIRIKDSASTPLLFIYIEECDMAAMDQERFSKSVVTINHNAKKANMKLIFSTSRPSPDVISKSLLASFDLVIAGHLASDADHNWLGVPKPKNWEQFSFIVVDNKNKLRVCTSRILLVEDDAVLAGLYSKSLRASGYETKVLDEAETALSETIEYKPALIITGILMPKISGFDLLDILKSTDETKDIPVLILSALKQPRDIARARDLGAVDYMVKSDVVIADVAEVVKDIITGSHKAFSWSDEHNISTINTENIKNADFTKDTEPRDDHLIDLLKQAYTNKITCRMAMADMSAIKPFSEYTPPVPEDYRKYFTIKARDDVPPSLHTYAKDGKLIMSDDYNAYAMYNELGFHRAVCIVLGDTPEIEGVEYHGEPFIMPPPTVEELPA